ncbi:tetratricopeptide repeat-containing sensor histidine kinase [Chryseobacterium echinoideorum]|uniref:tetratricopeptide repeat-containing sensor histidine kinase n=1 Tax=Chryseobacterium echinoideorum TaxID=1549648 RepID=UPI001185C461|nr:tetratricopeptide repeat-containing sensor histidine kinase [Chryseobacterium echinoideorum]
MKQTLLLILCFYIFSFNKTFAQTQKTVDSIRQIVAQQKAYPKKISVLQDHLKKIYQKDFDATIQLSRWGLELAKAESDKVNQGDFLRYIGLSYGKKGKIDSASVYYYQALPLLEKSGNSEKLGLLYDDMARMYRKLKQPKRSLEFYDKALKLYEDENDLEGIARINNESGVVFRDDFQNYKEANIRFEKSLRIQQQRNDSVGIGYALEFLGYNQLLIKDYKKSENYLKQALEIRKKLDDDFALMLNYTALGEFYKETKQHQLSNEYFEQSNALARKIKFTDIQKYNYEQITSNYEALGNYQKAFESLKSFNVLNDSLYTAQKLKDVEEISTKYETAEKENQILQQQAKLTNRNFWIFGLAALAVIIGLMGFLFYKQQVLKNLRQKQDNELKLAHQKIENQNKLQEQRLSISRDLHDNIGAQLSFIISAIDTIKYYVNDKDENLIGRLSNIGSFAKETIQELRDTIWAMNKQGITIKDLESRIANFIEKAKQSQSDTQIEFQVANDVSEEEVFTGIQGLNIFRIIQEATNNAFKYAVANRIEILISKENSALQFQVIDDGKGFKENEIEPGNGLLNMRKRALELNSELELQSELGKGTKVFFTVKS